MKRKNEIVTIEFLCSGRKLSVRGKKLVSKSPGLGCLGFKQGKLCLIDSINLILPCLAKTLLLA